MRQKDTLHIRVSESMLKELDILLEKGLFSNKNEIIRAAIRDTLLKYKDLMQK